jgi:hypothetical protein
MAYIHYNAQKHGVFKGQLDEYPYSSYRSLISNAPTLLERNFVLDYFGGIDQFIAYHESLADSYDLGDDLEP